MKPLLYAYRFSTVVTAIATVIYYDHLHWVAVIFIWLALLFIHYIAIATIKTLQEK